MREYTVVYKIGDNTKKKIVYDAPTQAEAKRLAKQDGYNVVKVVENFQIKGLDAFLEKQFPSMVKLTRKIILDFFTQMLFMIEADINLLKAIESMKRSAKKNKYRKFLNELNTGILQGKQLSDILFSKYGFEPEVKMQIQSGEKSGNIVSSLKTIVDRMTNESKTKSKVMKQLSYPAVVVAIMIGVSYYILTNVVPSLSSILVENGAELPPITLVMISVSNIAQNYGIYIIGSIVMLVLVLMFFKKSQKTGYYIDKIFLGLPIFGQVILLTSMSRYFYVASNMLNGDIPLVVALDIAAKSVPNKFLKRKLADFPTEIKKHGTQLDVLAANFNPTNEYADLIATGLTTGRINVIFEKISEDTLEKADSKVKTITSMMEPAITIMLGGVVALLVLSLFLPMFRIMDTMN